MTTSTTDLGAEVRAAVATVEDPEYPGLSIVDLGLLESVEIDDDGGVRVGLIPTFSGCPALAMIADDVIAAVTAIGNVGPVEVCWLTAPTWSVERVSDEARAFLADEFTVAVRIGTGPVACPRCGAPTTEQSLFGPSRCRSVHRCQNCVETVEVMRS